MLAITAHALRDRHVLIHQAVAVLSHYSFDLEFSYTLALLPSSVKEISEICVKIISNSMETLRSNTAAVRGMLRNVNQVPLEG